jgi:hypothetical protein
VLRAAVHILKITMTDDSKAKQSKTTHYYNYSVTKNNNDTSHVSVMSTVFEIQTAAVHISCIALRLQCIAM